MAVTILQQPDQYTPVYNDMVFVASSTNTAQANFKYVVDVWVNSSRISRKLVQPHPTYSTCVVDVKREISDYVSKNMDLYDASGFKRMTDSFVVAQVKFGEQYGPSSGITTYEGLTLSAVMYPFAGALNELDFLDYDQANILTSSGSVKGDFMTNRSRTYHSIKENQYDWLGIASGTSLDVYTGVVVTYDALGNTLQTFRFNNSSGTIGSDSNRYMKIMSGYNLNSLNQNNLTSGLLPVLSAGVSYYDIYIESSGGTRVTETLRTYIEPDCSWGDSYTVHFQNAYGVQESFRFTKWATKNEAIERQEYKKNTGTYGATSFTVSKSDRGYVNYYTKIDRTWVLRSDFLNDEMVEWIAELVESPEIYIEINSELIPVTVTNTNYEQITKQVNQLPQLELTVKFAQSDYRQLG